MKRLLMGAISLLVVGCLFSLIGFYVLYHEVNVHYPNAETESYLTSCNQTETDFRSSPISNALLFYFGANKCYQTTDSISQVEDWYQDAGWRENKEDGGMVREIRIDVPFLNKVTFQRVFITSAVGQTNIRADIMLTVTILPPRW
jgi:hypothetical protein